MSALPDIKRSLWYTPFSLQVSFYVEILILMARNGLGCPEILKLIFKLKKNRKDADSVGWSELEDSPMLVQKLTSILSETFLSSLWKSTYWLPKNSL